MKVPDVEFDRPACPIPGCLEDLVLDENLEYRCLECLISWGTDGGHGHLDDNVPRCGAIGTTFVESFRADLDVLLVRVCYLPAGHGAFRRPHAGYAPMQEDGERWSEWDSEERA